MSDNPCVDPTHPSPFQHFYIQPVAGCYDVRILAIRELRDYTQNIVGGLLDIVDALGLPEKQFKAVKKLIHRELWDEHFQKAVEWAEREMSIEHRQKIPLVSWSDVGNHRASHPETEPDFNVFPFSVSTPQNSRE